MILIVCDVIICSKFDVEYLVNVGIMFYDNIILKL